MKKYFGNYIGLVIQNNDPERMGKVKVFVPHISGTVYKKWVENKLNKKFNFPGNNLYSALTVSLTGGAGGSENVTTILDDLKNILPWAWCAAPLTSENSSGRFNAYNVFGNISDSNFYSTFSLSTSSAEDTPGKPGFFFEKEENRLSDAFTVASDNVNRPNPLSYEYVPSTYSNRAKGAFGVPAVGSHVWVFFRDGNPTQPVYFATAYGAIDWKGIYESYSSPGIDYPGTFENSISGNVDYNVNVETYRNKYVINQKGGAIEICNTDLKEKLKLTHYSGSFKEFNNSANIELATGNDQKLVLNDQYSTVRGFKNEYTGKNFDEIVLRDKYKKIGTLNADLMQQWKETFAPIQDNKQLFEIQRAIPNNVVDPNGNIVIKRNSMMQTRVGAFAPHPVLAGNNLYYSLNNTSIGVFNAQLTIAKTGINGALTLNVPDVPATKQAIFTTDTLDALEYQKQADIQWGPGGVGFSTSSQDGKWLPDIRKDLIKTLMEASMQQLADIENNLGIGGSEITQISKHKIETIGLAVNDFGSIRFDKIGKMLSNEMLIGAKGTYINYKESPLIEYTQVQDLPGGNYTLNVCNKFNVLVGAGGLHLKSLGPTNITGTVTNVVGEQLNLASENEVNIDSNTINISAEILRLRNKSQRQVLIDSSLGISKNVVVGGAISVEGEMFLQHVTAPAEYQVTENADVFGTPVPGIPVSVNIILQGVGVDPTDYLRRDETQTTTIPGQLIVTSGGIDMIKCASHAHIFKNLPLTLLNTNQEVRSAAGSINSTTETVPAARRYHRKK